MVNDRLLELKYTHHNHSGLHNSRRSNHHHDELVGYVELPGACR